ncbi:polymer-forming cytoskeletal protein [Treponema sp.]|uniref:bactofilin family protein n=1 Tax=Treponema sp. TaxID=166 RepID=UPI00298E56FB|nr:polymer-forming cytoskeletal protein [Treponema sp.]MCR5612760.1 polymer-forming cytoskeletal protein [Treponema sp.]
MASVDDISITTMVGGGSAFSGNLRVAGGMMVDGDIDGNIEISGNIIIAERARVRGNIVAKSAVISGIVIGDIKAPESVRLMSTSAVIGDISTHKLQVADKVILHGHCISIPDEELYQKEDSIQTQSKEIRSKAFVR